MNNKSSLLGGVALGVMLAGVMGSAAQAKTHHHKAAGDGGLAAKVEFLSNAVSDLETRLNDETQARQQAQAAADAAKANADDLAGEVADLKRGQAAQIETIPGEINTAIAANKPKPSWADTTHVGGQVFADVSHISQTPGPNAKNGVGLDVKRAYLSLDHTFNSVYSANVTLDLAPNGIIIGGGTYGTGTLQGSEAIKYAYLQAHYADALVLQVGAAKTPWIPFVDDVDGYRYIDKSITDQNKYGNSSDWGVNLHGDLGHGLFDYSVAALEGAGYKNPVRSTVPDFEGRVNVNYKGFVAAVGGYYGNLSTDVQGGAPNHPVSRLDFLAAYTTSKFRIGGEWFQANNWKTPAGTAAIAQVNPTAIYNTSACQLSGGTSGGCAIVGYTGGSAAVAAVPAKTDQTQGYSLFASYKFYPQWSIFGRYDGLSPSQKLAPLERYAYYNIGVSYEPVSSIDLALVYKHEDVTHAPKGGYADATTTLAPTSTGSLNTSGALDEVGVYAQYKF